MRVSYGEGPASHTGSESCGDIREDIVEALTRGCAGWVSSLENFIRSADGLRPSEGNTGRIDIARFVRTPRGPRPHARTQAPHEEGPGVIRAFRTEAGRSQVRLGRLVQVRAVNPKGERRR